jgi:hypothetical protein
MRILGPHDSHPLIGFNNEFKIGNVFSAKPEISGLGIHPSKTKVKVEVQVQRLDFP